VPATARASGTTRRNRRLPASIQARHHLRLSAVRGPGISSADKLLFPVVIGNCPNALLSLRSGIGRTVKQAREPEAARQEPVEERRQRIGQEMGLNLRPRDARKVRSRLAAKFLGGLG